MVGHVCPTCGCITCVCQQEQACPILPKNPFRVARDEPTPDPKGSLPPATSSAGSAGGDQRYLAILDEMRELHIKKSADYGRGQDPLANLRASTELGIPAWKGAIVRAMDKVLRIKSYCVNGKLENESLEDSLKDLAAYALLALVLYREEKQ